MPKGRKKGDGRGRLGGRVAGTPNKDNPLKQILMDHSMSYFTPKAAEDIERMPEEWKAEHQGQQISEFDADMLCMKATDRAKLEADLLNYHMPKMQAVSADVGVKVKNITLCERLAKLAAGEEIEN